MRILTALACVIAGATCTAMGIGIGRISTTGIPTQNTIKVASVDALTVERMTSYCGVSRPVRDELIRRLAAGQHDSVLPIPVPMSSPLYTKMFRVADEHGGTVYRFEVSPNGYTEAVPCNRGVKGSA